MVKQRILHNSQMRKITISIPVELFECIKREAYNQEKSISLLLHEILDYNFQEDLKQPKT